MNIIGISAYYHDSAAALIRDGEIIAAAQEERFTRKKGDHRFPSQSLHYVLKAGGLGSVNDADYLVFYDKPLIKFERLLSTYIAYAPSGVRSFIKAMPLWLKEKLHMPREIRKLTGYEGKILFAQHHESHAASAFYPSP
ncbi:MAG: carbamoyltransferase N-terminal domain-containing protein, partial [Thermoanaerobaculia bacterium]